MTERGSEPYPARNRFAPLTQPWASSSSPHHSSPSLTSVVPLGQGFARYGLDWNAPLQTSDASRHLASPIKIRDLPTPPSTSNVSDPEPEPPRSDWLGPSRKLTYGEAPKSRGQPSYWRGEA
jgi:hypothetical protein